MSDQDPYGDPTRVDTPAADGTMEMPAATGATPPAEPPATGEPPSEPPDRRRWILIALVIAILLALLAWFLLRDDDSDDTDTSDTTTTTESTTTTSVTTTTAPTTTAPTTTTSAPPATIDPARCVTSAPDDPDTTAELVYDAFTVGDRACASNVMTASALDQLFAIPGAGGGWTSMGCQEIEDPDPQTQCSYSFLGGSTTFRMNYSDTDGWTVYEVFQTPD